MLKSKVQTPDLKKLVQVCKMTIYVPFLSRLMQSHACLLIQVALCCQLAVKLQLALFQIQQGPETTIVFFSLLFLQFSLPHFIFSPVLWMRFGIPSLLSSILAF